MSDKSMRGATRLEWIYNGDGPTDENLRTGCLLRIADSVEKMAVNHVKTQSDLDNYKRWHKDRGEQIARLEKTISGLKGVITKLKSRRDAATKQGRE